ncbi:peptide/nickel transport system ATP-binding protein/peptide/nickel transport system ATP-binding protein [Arboricoccus pini]|uniref:Peptide/nickel transport system ATP-binding protein/peptide/nickel transport system ATP-binding protein n=1 Tax=Arboricoccus pini TaxID=1963835 RepID=A0A212QMZ2_9PROT|nr:ATP-binding cassette domain-containing protein [Arboricoccus pini]SNB60715.1 peptide/nickel transport system ATP-binding protein/peptide/nickel transport system ATP-binding protein [Arboricoccus pini]
MTEPLLRVEGLSKRFHGKDVVVDVDLSLTAGETLVVIGASGVGKTTLARLILCLVEPDAGAIHLDGIDLVGLRGAARRRHRRALQMVFQDSLAALNPRADVLRLLTDPLRVRLDIARSRRTALIHAVLDDVDLDPGLLGRPPHALSGGQRQRVALARALLADARLIIMDEPMAAQDAVRRLRLAALVKRLQAERNLSFLVITHDLETAAILADRVAVMASGRLVETGPAERILRQPASDAARHLLAARLRLPPAQTKGGD